MEPDFFLLSATPHDVNESLSDEHFSFYMREIEVPRYLKDTRMVERYNLHTIKFRETKRWGEPLEDGLARVVGENLCRHFHSSSSSIFPNRRKDSLRWDISISFSSFEKHDDLIVMHANWSAKCSDKKIISDSLLFELKLGNDHSIDTELDAYNQCLYELASGIARKLSAE